MGGPIHIYMLGTHRTSLGYKLVPVVCHWLQLLWGALYFSLFILLYYLNVLPWTHITFSKTTIYTTKWINKHIFYERCKNLKNQETRSAWFCKSLLVTTPARNKMVNVQSWRHRYVLWWPLDILFLSWDFGPYRQEPSMPWGGVFSILPLPRCMVFFF